MKKSSWLVPGFVLFALAFVLYGNSIRNEYAMDDAIVILKNRFVMKGADGIPGILKYDTFAGFFGEEKQLVTGGRYRPLSLITFALENQVFGTPAKNNLGEDVLAGDPHRSHAINVLLFALTAVLLYYLLMRLLGAEGSSKGNKWWFSVPFLASLLFVTHPVHTEAIANIKGRDEIMTLLGALLALKFSLDYFDSDKRKYLIYSGASMFLGLMSKENAITFLAVIPAALYFFRETDLKKIMWSFAPLLGASVLFLIIRYAIIGFPTGELPAELMNNPYLEMNTGQKYATIVYTLGRYVQLLFFPHPLTFDYYPYHIPIIEIADLRFVLPFLFHLGLVVLSIWSIKRKNVYGFLALFYLATLSIVSNLFFPIGVFMNERFIYIPSIAWCIAVPMLLKEIPNWKQQFSVYLLGVVSLLFSIKTIARNPIWMNDFTLFQNDIKVSVNSAKGNVTAGGSLQTEAQKEKDPAKAKEMYEQSIAYLERALEIHPRYIDAMLLLGNTHFRLNEDLDKAFEYYFMILNLEPFNQNVVNNFGVLMNGRTTPEYRANIWERVLKGMEGADQRRRSQINSLNAMFNVAQKLGRLYGREIKDLKQAQVFFGKAVAIARERLNIAQQEIGTLGVITPAQANKDLAIVLKDLGVVHALLKESNAALTYFLETERITPNDANLLQNISIAYGDLGNEERSNAYRIKAAQMRK